MGGSSFSTDTVRVYSDRVTHRAVTGTSAFAYDADIKTGKSAARVHATMDPYGVIRESRDSDAHPVTLPISIVLDTTGSMRSVPAIIESKLPELMGFFLGDKASGKRYLGEAYPAIMICAVDDYDAMGGGRGCGALQVGQFESGIEIDDDLTSLWITHRGGGTYEESYELAAYFLARRVITDSWEKRRKKGYVFIIGDENYYKKVSSNQLSEVIGCDTEQGDIETVDIFKELQEKNNVFFIIPNMTQHYSDVNLYNNWVRLLGQQNVLKLDDPNKICELIASAVAICENYVNKETLLIDGADANIVSSLAVVKSHGGDIESNSKVKRI